MILNEISQILDRIVEKVGRTLYKKREMGIDSNVV